MHVVSFEDDPLTDYLTEQEQIELIKSWIKQYGLVILAGIVFATVLLSGWRYWQHRQAKILTHASNVYDELLYARAQNDTNAMNVQAKKLFSHYPQTSYGQLAALMLARNAIAAKNYPEAESKLHWVIDHSSTSALREIASLRLARVMLAEQQAQAALDLLQKIEDKSFIGLRDEIRGDAYVALKKIALARESYQAALQELPNAETARPLLQMKYDNLALIK